MVKTRTVISHLCQKTQQRDCDVQCQFTLTHLVSSSYSRYHQLNTHTIARVHYSKQERPILIAGVVSMTTTCIPCLSPNILLKLTFPYKQTSCVIQFLDYSGFSNGKVSFTDNIKFAFLGVTDNSCNSVCGISSRFLGITNTRQRKLLQKCSTKNNVSF